MFERPKLFGKSEWRIRNVTFEKQNEPWHIKIVEKIRNFIERRMQIYRFAGLPCSSTLVTKKLEVVACLFRCSNF